MSAYTKILIVEDEILIADYLQEILREENFTNVKMAHDKEEALLQMETFQPNIILMDININGENSGIELVKRKNEQASVIYITGQHDAKLMSQAFKTNPESYLTKPINRNDLMAAIRLMIFKKKDKFITIKDGYKEIRVHLDEILFVKSENNYIDIQLETIKITVRQSLDAFTKAIQSDDFVRIHRSYLINSSKITSKKSNSVFINQFEIPFSRNMDISL